MAKYNNDTEVLKTYMKTEYMDSEQQFYFKQKLEDDKKNLLDRIESVKEEISHLKSNESDINDNATVDEILNRNLSFSTTPNKTLTQN